jgi:protein-L-isoaspartate(D-aspartate) O-methyltransferase
MYYCILLPALLLPLVHCSDWRGPAPAPSFSAAADSFEAQREAMVREQIEARGVRDKRVLAAMRAVPRHAFVPEAVRAQAYADQPLPIGEGQTISQPYIVAFMSELLNLEKGHRVLEIGTGSGYQAAVLAALGGEVYSIEIVAALAERARAALEGLGYQVNLRLGNGYAGWPEQAPFDRVVLTAAPDRIPQALLDQLRPGGRLVAPVGPSGGLQELVVADKRRNGEIREERVLAVRFVPMVDEPGGVR